jgi:hypothetical protein
MFHPLVAARDAEDTSLGAPRRRRDGFEDVVRSFEESGG